VGAGWGEPRVGVGVGVEEDEGGKLRAAANRCNETSASALRIKLAARAWSWSASLTTEPHHALHPTVLPLQKQTPDPQPSTPNPQPLDPHPCSLGALLDSSFILPLLPLQQLFQGHPHARHPCVRQQGLAGELVDEVEEHRAVAGLPVDGSEGGADLWGGRGWGLGVVGVVGVVGWVGEGR